MPRFPYFGFPYPYYQNYTHSPKYYNKQESNIPSYNSVSSKENSKINNLNNQYHNENFEHTSQNSSHIPPESSERNSQKSSNSNEQCIFEIFGIKLFYDDILILSLIYFLYTEGVKDEGLFISLLLLLIS